MIATFAGCSSDDAPPDGNIGVDKVRNSLLKAADIGPTWKAPTESAAPGQLVSICGGDTAAAGIPGSPTLISVPLSDEGTKGVQSLTQHALVYEDEVAALTSVATLRTIADACPPSVAKPRKDSDRQEPAYTETAATSDFTEGDWVGFVTTRSKLYEAEHPATADVAVAVVAKGNVVLVDQYAIYRLGVSNASANPQFAADWKKLVGTTLNRINS